MGLRTTLIFMLFAWKNPEIRVHTVIYAETHNIITYIIFAELHKRYILL